MYLFGVKIYVCCAVGCAADYKLDRAIARWLTSSAGEDPGPGTSLGDGALRGRGGMSMWWLGRGDWGAAMTTRAFGKESLNLFGNGRTSNFDSPTVKPSLTNFNDVASTAYSTDSNAGRTLPRYTPTASI